MKKSHFYSALRSATFSPSLRGAEMDDPTLTFVEIIRDIQKGGMVARFTLVERYLHLLKTTEDTGDKFYEYAYPKLPEKDRGAVRKVLDLLTQPVEGDQAREWDDLEGGGPLALCSAMLNALQELGQKGFEAAGDKYRDAYETLPERDRKKFSEALRILRE